MSVVKHSVAVSLWPVSRRSVASERTNSGSHSQKDQGLRAFNELQVFFLVALFPLVPWLGRVQRLNNIVRRYIFSFPQICIAAARLRRSRRSELLHVLDPSGLLGEFPQLAGGFHLPPPARRYSATETAPASCANCSRQELDWPSAPAAPSKKQF